jgi:hypothetical protein
MKPGGELSVQNLGAGSYWIELEPPDRHWYVARLEREAAAAAKPTPLAGKPLRVGAGEQVRGVRVALSGGAAAVRGRVASTTGEKLPFGLRVALVPVSAETRDDPLRHYDAAVDDDGAYLIEYVAPGDYLAVAVAPKEGEAAGRLGLAWDEAARAAARKAAEARGVRVTLGPCARRDGLDLGF